MASQQWERTGFLILLCLIFAVLAWILITDAPSESIEVQDDSAVESSVIVSQIQPIRDEAAEAEKARKALQAKQAADAVKAYQAEQAKQRRARESLKVRIPVFASRRDGEKAFTSFSGWSDLIVVNEADSVWSKVASAKGFPVWVSASLVEKLNKSHVRIKSNNVNLRSTPQIQGSRVLGRAQAGEIMKVNRKQGDWLRVWAPLRITAWAKSAELVPQNVASSSVQTPM